MTNEEIDILARGSLFPDPCSRSELVTTHISWVILCENYAYKIKKPIHYSFLDFSTLEKRRHFCNREIELNSRFTKDIYLNVEPVFRLGDQMGIGRSKNKIIDYAVRMHRFNRDRQMNVMLAQDKVHPQDMEKLARKIAEFHESAPVIHPENPVVVGDLFDDLYREKEFLSTRMGEEQGKIIDRAISSSHAILDRFRNRCRERADSGYYRDGHGDLHSRNIVFLSEPQPFDCIEFNDSYRQIDVLNEVAFLCMDLDAFGREDLSGIFIEAYNRYFPSIESDADLALFLYYKAYRANIRAKVNSLRARSALDVAEKNSVLSEVGRYLRLMKCYLESPVFSND